MHPDQIKELIRAGMACEHLALDGDGQHFAAIVVSAEFVGLNRVQRQQHVYRTIKDELASGELHALSFKTLTPEEWSAERG
ncbi:MAG: BolA/IbaG family iron-sulfur metabolism protein [Dechloromonas sp.]|jgi:acid stress-induced BolA-like protein IbaG/YrbA|uniref:BolA/IbaG family iron-sulfur metabolism protein n=1 Tax=Candidatus Dechloromonas phosphorivorans TaxID=2899244 RepID=A0A9D7QJF6_9RHOO|nr:BolA/IbaG family iron-sulfur metabolism protein [Candidatus Dechloromonas phosphorivorans]